MSEETTETKPSWRDKTLKAAGAGYAIGDLAMGVAAKLRGEKDIYNGALIWLMGGLAAARYGNPHPYKQLEIFSQKFEKHLSEQGITVPDHARAQDALLKKPSFFQRCELFLYQHPSEMLNIAYAIGAGFLLKKGFKEMAAGEKDFWPHFPNGFSKEGIFQAVNGMSKNTWMGALVGGGALSGLLIKEDPHATEHAAHGTMLQKAAAWIKEKPLRLTGALYGANNIFTVLKAVEDHSNRALYKGALKPHYFSGMTAATYILSNVLLTTVTRNQVHAKNFSAEAFGKLEHMAATVIAAQSPENQQALLADTANYMANQKGIGLTAPQIAEQLAHRITALTQERLQPAVNEVSWTHREKARAQGTQQAVSI